MAQKTKKLIHNASRKNKRGLITVNRRVTSLRDWIVAYFEFEVATLESSRYAQRRDLNIFLTFYEIECGHDLIDQWSPRLSGAYQQWLKQQKDVKQPKERRWNDRSVNRMVDHLKTFAKWVHKLRPLPLGNPTEKLKSLQTENLLMVERGISQTERRRLLDAADLLVQTGGRSRDRHRFRDQAVRPQRHDYRPYRNRAIIYTLIETGMRRAAIVAIDVKSINDKDRSIATVDKGDKQHKYQTSREGLQAIKDYLKHERPQDAKAFKGSPALFLPAQGKVSKQGRLSVRTINNIWQEVCATAGVEGKTPHSARHGMGAYLIKKTGNVSAVQRQLGHKNAAYSMQYMRITQEELNEVLDERE